MCSQKNMKISPSKFTKPGKQDVKLSLKLLAKSGDQKWFSTKVQVYVEQGIIVMGVTFNVLNALMQGGWIFYLSPEDYYGRDWLTDPRFIAGFLIFIIGMYINIQSDDIIRNLRKDGDTRHYLPKGGMFRYVTSANYFGEFVEWVGFAILTWSWAGAVFALWTFANLGPRASRIYDKYKVEFGDELDTKKVKRIIPFIY